MRSSLLRMDADSRSLVHSSQLWLFAAEVNISRLSPGQTKNKGRPRKAAPSLWVSKFRVSKFPTFRNKHSAVACCVIDYLAPRDDSRATSGEVALPTGFG
jgi:hypothetical protein